MGRNKRKEECAKDADALEASAADSGERTSPPVTRRREQPRAGDVLIQVECGLNVGQVCLNKLRHGSRGACVKFDGNWMTPNQFQMISGRETAKDWKRSIKHHGKTLKSLMNNELLLLEPPVCLCEVCTADDAVKVINHFHLSKSCSARMQLFQSAAGISKNLGINPCLSQNIGMQNFAA